MPPSRAERIEYYKAAASFWHEAIKLQKHRCLEAEAKENTYEFDVRFYIVSVIRLREVARQIRDRLRINEVRSAIDRFDSKWPRIRKLRNSDEHIRGPSGNFPCGVWYFGDKIADLKPFGKVEYIVDMNKLDHSIDDLYQTIQESLSLE